MTRAMKVGVGAGLGLIAAGAAAGADREPQARRQTGGRLTRPFSGLGPATRLAIRVGCVDRGWVDPWSLQRREVVERPGGRPYSEANAWALLNLVENRSVDWVSDPELARLRLRLRKHDLAELAPRLRRRAAVHRYRVHRGLFGRLAEEPSLVLGGISAAGHYAADILGGREVEGYVGSEEHAALVRRYALEADPDGDVLLHVVEKPDRLALRGGVLSPVVVALDLMESVDARSRRAGGDLLERCGDDRPAG